MHVLSGVSFLTVGVVTVAFGGRGYNLALELTKTIVEDYGKEVVLLLSSQNTNQQVPYSAQLGLTD
jgi:hypothetical protein